MTRDEAPSGQIQKWTGWRLIVDKNLPPETLVVSPDVAATLKRNEEFIAALTADAGKEG